MGSLHVQCMSTYAQTLYMLGACIDSHVHCCPVHHDQLQSCRSQLPFTDPPEGLRECGVSVGVAQMV